MPHNFRTQNLWNSEYEWNNDFMIYSVKFGKQVVVKLVLFTLINYSGKLNRRFGNGGVAMGCAEEIGEDPGILHENWELVKV